MKVIKENITLLQFKAWSGAIGTKQTIIDLGLEEAFDEYICELYPEGITETQLNDILWFEDEEELLEILGYARPVTIESDTGLELHEGDSISLWEIYDCDKDPDGIMPLELHELATFEKDGMYVTVQAEALSGIPDTTRVEIVEIER